MNKLVVILSLLLIIPCAISCAQQSQNTDNYTFKNGDPNGIGKWYKGREIAYVMGYQGMQWLERDTREEEENTTTLLKNMDIKPTDVIADIGAGSGYHVFKMAKMTNQGAIYAVDIQDEMLAAMQYKIELDNVNNVTLIKGSEQGVNLTPNSVDKVLMVDVYHEFSYPLEIINSIKAALRPGGKIYLIEYRAEDDWVPIKKIHKMTQKQAVLEMTAAGFKLEQNISNLPWQHCMVFVKQ